MNLWPPRWNLLTLSVATLTAGCGAPRELGRVPDAGVRFGSPTDGSANALCTPACVAGEECEGATGKCITVLAEGAACSTAPSPDGGVADGPPAGARCQDGLACAEVGGDVRRCSKDCSAKNAAEVCGTGGKCFSRPGSTTQGFCGRISSEGEACDSAALLYCSGKQLSCIVPTTGATLGKCFLRCDPSAPDCAAGKSCADPFPDATTGICVVPPGPYPKQCDHAQLVFCGKGEACTRPSSASFGYCHLRCVAGASACPAGEECAEPDPGVKICVKPVATNQRCAALDDRYCGVKDICVKVGADTVCRVDCTAKGEAACTSPARCSKLDGSDRKACL
jgi:hypothetical protein